MSHLSISEQTGKNGKPYEIMIDSLLNKVWINGEDGSAVARFNPSTGVDVHNSVTDQLKGMPECVWCTHEKPNYDTWLAFIDHVQDNFGIKLATDTINPDSLANPIKHNEDI